MTVRTYKLCKQCYSYQSASRDKCVSLECMSDDLEIVMIQSQTHVSLRKIRRERKKYKIWKKIAQLIVGKL